MKKTALLLILAIVALVGGCVSTTNQSSSPADKTPKVGVTAGPHAQIMAVVQQVAEKDGLKIQIVEFADYIQPNVALSKGDIDLNSFQHQPYLEHVIADRKYDLIPLAKTVLFPMGVYSQKVRSLTELKVGATIAIPDDPTNGGRSLLLLEKAGLIKLKRGTGLKASVRDIAENPRKITFKELDASRITRHLPDVDAAVINSNFAMQAGFVPVTSAIFLEDAHSPYANIIAIRAKDKDHPAYQKFLKSYHSDEVKAYVQDHFKGSVITTW